MRKKNGGTPGKLFIVGSALFLLLHLGGLSLGTGNGNGDVKTETVDKVEETIVTIVVTQDQYLIEEQEVTLRQIKEKVTDKSATIKVILEDNYASAKAWDDIKVSLTEWGIVPIEQ